MILIVDFDFECIFEVVVCMYECIEGVYVVIVVIVGYGLFVFCDLFGICFLIFGCCFFMVFGVEGCDEWVVVSELFVLENGDYEVVCEVEFGEVVFIMNDGELFIK